MGWDVLRLPQQKSALGLGTWVLETFTVVVGETSQNQVLQSPEHLVLEFSGVCWMGTIHLDLLIFLPLCSYDLLARAGTCSCSVYFLSEQVMRDVCRKLGSCRAGSGHAESSRRLILAMHNLVAIGTAQWSQLWFWYIPRFTKYLGLWARNRRLVFVCWCPPADKPLWRWMASISDVGDGRTPQAALCREGSVQQSQGSPKPVIAAALHDCLCSLKKSLKYTVMEGHLDSSGLFPTW